MNYRNWFQATMKATTSPQDDHTLHHQPEQVGHQVVGTNQLFNFLLECLTFKPSRSLRRGLSGGAHCYVHVSDMPMISPNLTSLPL